MKQIAKTYDHNQFEEKIYEQWEKSGYFKPEANMKNPPTYDRKVDGDPFVIMMPPPNVTGKLHVGHSLVLTIEDIMTRFHRLLGQPTLWLPGMDHAGIATQTVVDKALKKKGIDKKDLGREKFIEEVWKWKEEYGGIILRQTRKMGASCDWSRERFTLDEGLNNAVKEAFVNLYDKGLIYKGKYVVNWCPKCQTAIADDEVEYCEQHAKLFYFKYDKNFPITIATTRPETKLGDTGVAVNPSDKRYREFIGKEYEVNIDGVKRKIKVFADRSIDMNFGTGAVGVTPAHSVVDWKMAAENGLPVIEVIDQYGKMTEESGKYAGMKAKEAGQKLVEYLKENNLLEKEEDYENNLSICYRCNTAIEPLPSMQWFVKMKPLAEKAKAAVESGKIKIIPSQFEKVYFHWMDNIRDWCISRQLWWGHRLPVWYRKKSEALSTKSETNSKIQNTKPKTKVWDLKIYGKEIFNAIKSGKKSIDTRAGREKGDGIYWGDIKPGDVIRFTLADQNSDKPVSGIKPDEREVSAVTHFDNIDDLLSSKKIENIWIDSNVINYRQWWKKMPELQKRIEQFGIWAIELKPINNSTNQPINQDEIYVGVKPPKDPENWEQDPDVLDTWFSSALWPFSTLGWPNTDDKDFKYFYPTSVLETGKDILFFWVAKMVMMGLELTEEIPFENVYLHGMVRDEQNRKMSKSLGNALDPLEILPQYGADALRMALVVGSTPGQDIAVGESKIKGFRNFSNKIWNASRFVALRVSEGDLQTGEIGSHKISDLEIDKNILTDADKEILKKHKETIASVTKKIEKYKFSQAGEELYEYFWHTFCDIYIEQAKGQLIARNNNQETNSKQEPINQLTNQAYDNTKKILIKILTESLVMLHPFVPFVTEAVWQELREIYPSLSEFLMIAKWPEAK